MYKNTEKNTKKFTEKNTEIVATSMYKNTEKNTKKFTEKNTEKNFLYFFQYSNTKLKQLFNSYFFNV